MPQNKKIAFGVNLFGNTVRTDLCIQSLLKVKEKYPDIIDLYNVQFKDVTKKGREHPQIKTLRVLEESNLDYVTDTKRTIPMMRDLFDKLADLDYEYFGFTNDDIIISDRLIKHFIETDFDSWSVSRLAIEPITSLTQTISGDHYQVAGFDANIIKTKWWKENSKKFPNYVLGHPCWDVHYATLLMRHGNSCLCNKWPPLCFHIKHGDDSHYSSPERDYNYKLYWEPSKFDVDMWHHYLFNVLLIRPGNNYWEPHPNELELEKICFNDKWFKEHYWSYQDYQKQLAAAAGAYHQ